MTTTTKLVATVFLAGGLAVTTGIGLTQGGGDGPAAAAAKAAPPAKAEALKPSDAATKPDAPKVGMTDPAIRAALSKPCGLRSIDSVTVGILLDQVEADHGIAIRFDLAAYKRLRIMGLAPDDDTGSDFTTAAVIKKLYGVKLSGRVSAESPLTDLLTDVCAQLPGNHSYRIRNGQILIGPAYMPPCVPDRVAEEGELRAVEWSRILEQIYGEPVSLSVEEKPFQDAIKELRRLTGANIVVNIAADRAKDKSMLVTATFDDVRLYTALNVLGDMVGLKPVFLNNVYYLTSPENAEKLQKKMNEELYGRERKPPVVPAGYLTDGVNFFVKPADLKPVAPSADGSLPPVPATK